VIALTLALAYGIWYGYSVILVALLAEFGWSRSVLAGAFSVFTLVHGGGNPLIGALCARYHGDADPSKFEDGWLRTGDVGTLTPDGFLTLTDRVKDVIKSGGDWISSVELENQVMSHPAVAEACVVPKPDPEIGNRIRAVLVLRDGNVPSEALANDIRATLKGRIAPYKVPQIVEFTTALPKSAGGMLKYMGLLSVSARLARIG
jgi:acyl-CoA synthetase (AMP-forming)/AMP-acid ligase II